MPPSSGSPGTWPAQALRRIDDWQDRRATEDPAWIAVAEQNDYGEAMTPPEVAAMLAEVHELVLRHIDAAGRARATGGSDAADPVDPAAVRFTRLLVYALPDAAPGS